LEFIDTVLDELKIYEDFNEIILLNREFKFKLQEVQRVENMWEKHLMKCFKLSDIVKSQCKTLISIKNYL
jgi:hypothetical protein